MGEKRQVEWGVLTAPMVGFLLLFLGFPALVNIVYSLSSVSFQTLRAPELSGFSNYLAVLADSDFWRSIWFSLRFGIITALAECLIGFFLAIFLAPLFEKRSWLLAIIMLPLMVAPALVGLMYRLVLHEFVGPVPHYLWAWFSSAPAFLNVANAFWTLVVIETLQWTPFAFLLFYMAYRAIPLDIREAAQMDGSSGWDTLWRIEIPLMAPTIAIAIFIRFIDGFRVFDNVYVLTGSGPGGSTRSLSIYIYEAFFRQGEIGPAVAASVLLFIASFAVLFFINQGLARRAR
ncbi:sugar ABC transporter permease [Pelagibacterium sp. H642]|uniref:carbohydrate ABC transporter permease n=1 Tax=Pelagibacterium sp. H642 TaxID=1881069 RepID=UPI0028159230|nr:sugar ABC transporter permease [Pelagibacterium sp. H642]WMT92765.1 sugar ABC transporter permease [Pelagibacterium sp. H642]